MFYSFCLFVCFQNKTIRGKKCGKNLWKWIFRNCSYLCFHFWILYRSLWKLYEQFTAAFSISFQFLHITPPPPPLHLPTFPMCMCTRKTHTIFLIWLYIIVISKLCGGVAAPICRRHSLKSETLIFFPKLKFRSSETYTTDKKWRTLAPSFSRKDLQWILMPPCRLHFPISIKHGEYRRLTRVALPYLF